MSSGKQSDDSPGAEAPVPEQAEAQSDAPASRRPVVSEKLLNRGTALVFAVAVVAAIAAAIIAISSGARLGANAGNGRERTLTRQQQHGRELFAQHCAVCHTLAAANAVGDVGPDLDAVSPTASVTLAAIQQGPAGMPVNVLVGANARAVAQFVGAATGH